MDIADGIREFMNRDWDLFVRHEREHWAREYERRGWRATWEASQDLLAHVQHVRPGPPAPFDRQQDLEAHLALKAKLDRAAPAFARR